MQVISSPTRKEVDLAHQRGRWLDVGIPSTRNLMGISWTRIVMWGILALSKSDSRSPMQCYLMSTEEDHLLHLPLKYPRYFQSFLRDAILTMNFLKVQSRCT